MPHQPRPSRLKQLSVSLFDAPRRYGTMERYCAFTPGLNPGAPDVSNAPVGSRIAALTIDAALYSALLISALIAITVATGNAWWWFLLFGGVVPAYLLQSALDAGGGSIGKRMMGLRVVGPADVPVSFGQAARRNSWLLLPLIPFAGPFITVGVAGWFAASARTDAFGMGPHDRTARTRVIQRGTRRSGGGGAPQIQASYTD